MIWRLKLRQDYPKGVASGTHKMGEMEKEKPRRLDGQHGWGESGTYFETFRVSGGSMSMAAKGCRLALLSLDHLAIFFFGGGARSGSRAALIT